MLVGLVQNENRRQELLLERAKFEDHLETKERQLERERQAMIRKEKEEEARARAGSEMSQRLLKQIIGLAPAKKAPATPPSAV